MFIKDGIAYSGEKTPEIEVDYITLLDDMMMLVTFTTGERRLFDASRLLQYSAFKPLANAEVFKTAKVEYGVVVWNNGEIDIAPETMYEESYPYN